MLDSTLVAALVGVVPALFALLYTKLSVDQLRRQTDLLHRSQHFLTSHELMVTTTQARQEWVKRMNGRLDPEDLARSPIMAEMIAIAGDLEGLYVVRLFLEQMQEMYFARKHDLVSDDHWPAMHRIVRGFFGPKEGRALFERMVQFGWLTEGFVAFADDYHRTLVWKDPLGRLPGVPSPANGPAPKPA